MKQVWHIYYATRGAAGAYIDALLRASAKAGISARAFVSANYRFSFGAVSKVFFPLTDKSERRNQAIRLLRGVELLFGYLYVTVRLIVARPKVMLHYIDDFYLTYLFFRVWRALGVDVSLTCHDVGSHYLGMNHMRVHMFEHATTLVVHNNAAREALIQSMGERIAERVVTYPFPFSSYDDILDEERLHRSKKELKRLIGSDGGYYLFLGVVRRTKGIEELITAWSQANKDHTHKLVIAGAWTDPDPQVRSQVDNDPSCVVIDRYISDEEFALLIAQARFVVLPYHEYAHSSVILSCGNHDGAVIISDIGLFTELLPEYPLTHKNRDVQSLAHVLRQSMSMTAQECATCKAMLALAVARANKRLVGELRNAYADIVNTDVVAAHIDTAPELHDLTERHMTVRIADAPIAPSPELRKTAMSIPAIASFALRSNGTNHVEFVWDGDTIPPEELDKLTEELARQCGSGVTITMRKSDSISARQLSQPEMVGQKK